MDQASSNQPIVSVSSNLSTGGPMMITASMSDLQDIVAQMLQKQGQQASQPATQSSSRSDQSAQHLASAPATSAGPDRSVTAGGSARLRTTLPGVPAEPDRFEPAHASTRQGTSHPGSSAEPDRLDPADALARQWSTRHPTLLPGPWSSLPRPGAEYYPYEGYPFSLGRPAHHYPQFPPTPALTPPDGQPSDRAAAQGSGTVTSGGPAAPARNPHGSGKGGTGSGGKLHPTRRHEAHFSAFSGLNPFTGQPVAFPDYPSRFYPWAESSPHMPPPAWFQPPLLGTALSPSPSSSRNSAGEGSARSTPLSHTAATGLPSSEFEDISDEDVNQDQDSYLEPPTHPDRAHANGAMDPESSGGKDQDEDGPSEKESRTLETLSKDLVAFAQEACPQILAEKKKSTDASGTDPIWSAIVGGNEFTPGPVFKSSTLVDSIAQDEFEKHLKDRCNRSLPPKGVHIRPKTNKMTRFLEDDGRPPLSAEYNLWANFSANHKEGNSPEFKKVKYMEEVARRNSSINHFLDALVNMAVATNCTQDTENGGHKWKQGTDCNMFVKNMMAMKEAIKHRARVDANLEATALLDRRELALAGARGATDIKHTLLRSPRLSPGLFGTSELEKGRTELQTLATTQAVFRSSGSRDKHSGAPRHSGHSQYRKASSGDKKPRNPQQSRPSQHFRERSPLRGAHQPTKASAAQPHRKNFRPAKRFPKKN